MIAPLLDLTPIALALWCIAFALAASVFVKAFFKPLIDTAGHLPGIGGWLSNALRAIENGIIGVFGAIYNGGDALLGAAWHLLAKQIGWLWRELVGHADLIASVIPVMGSIAALLHLVRGQVHSLTHGAHSSSGRVKLLEREFHGIEHGVRTFEHRINSVVNKDVLPEIKSLDKEVAHVTGVAIPGIRSIAQGAEQDVTALGKWVKDHALVAGTAAFVGAVVWALEKLGLGWLRCRSNPFNNNTAACGLWGDLANLLELAVIAGEIASLDELVKTAQGVTEEITHGVEELLQV